MVTHTVTHLIVQIPLTLFFFFLQSLSKGQRSGSLCFRGDRAAWFQPDSLDEFLRLKWEHPDAKVVVGNTEVGESSPTFTCSFVLSSVRPRRRWLTLSALCAGIEVKFKNMLYPVILAPAFIPELSGVTQSEDGERLFPRCMFPSLSQKRRDDGVMMA